MIRRLLIAPDTVSSWLVLTIIWMSVTFSASLLVGLSLERPRDGLSAGIFLSGLCLTYTIDQLWVDSTR
ncbi:hypothetical protein halTADL_0132 [Halohasta litchfieldiae]|jgi:hypothetical protein|uniref:Uncharacterized protein n=1 Tax=Halohasta litchfieldiae TaxID=1073996 RepID=A0A1H6T229_9EURY|nr:hypothetical protein [Halohasta litchfieldiae]ATW86954.1 hypothetical protein halTADL_0132 [Halohasta litchfieldiae]SEI71157.1 hypothetical protein SAMN05444271_10663 [Halohasta litchfieldiae]